VTSDKYQQRHAKERKKKKIESTRVHTAGSVFSGLVVPKGLAPHCRPHAIVAEQGILDDDVDLLAFHFKHVI
jgi:hypothetical protein